jgi:hypothetical protein
MKAIKSPRPGIIGGHEAYNDFGPMIEATSGRLIELKERKPRSLKRKRQSGHMLSNLKAIELS